MIIQPSVWFEQLWALNIPSIHSVHRLQTTTPLNRAQISINTFRSAEGFFVEQALPNTKPLHITIHVRWVFKYVDYSGCPSPSHLSSRTIIKLVNECFWGFQVTHGTTYIYVLPHLHFPSIHINHLVVQSPNETSIFLCMIFPPKVIPFYVVAWG